MSVCPDGTVLVRAPYGAGREQIGRFVSSKQRWIGRQRDRMAQMCRARAQVQPLSAAELAELTARARDDLGERCRRLAPQVGADYGRITIRHQRTRWGSCSAGGDLNFNCLLMLAPEPVRDYVVVHELCHRLHMDHSAAFWQEVSRVTPDWRQQRRWLRENGADMLARLGPGPKKDKSER